MSCWSFILFSPSAYIVYSIRVAHAFIQGKEIIWNFEMWITIWASERIKPHTAVHVDIARYTLCETNEWLLIMCARSFTVH